MDTTKDQELLEFLSDVEGRVRENFQRFGPMLSLEYGWPELDPVRIEIVRCLILNLNQAAIALCNHLLEAFLKYALMWDDLREELRARGDNNPVGPEEWLDMLAASQRKYNSKDLAPNIDRAFKRGLVSQNEKDLLHGFRDDFRNAFSHADKAKTFGDLTADLQPFNIGDGQERIQSRKLPVSGLIFAQGVLQAMMAGQAASSYFGQLSQVIQRVWDERLKP